jgi:hypothetical protein
MKTLKVTPLTATQNQELKEFIGDCVMSNRKFSFLTSRFGANSNFTIQELVNSNVETLQDIGANVQKTLNGKESISVEFGGKGAESYKISGVEATTLVQMLKFMITAKLVAEHRAELKTKLETAELEASKFETNSEKKRKAQTALRNAKLELESFSS